MERRHEETVEAQESARRSARPVGWFGPQRGKTTREQTERSQGWSGQKSQENARCQAKCPSSTAWTTEEGVNAG